MTEWDSVGGVRGIQWTPPSSRTPSWPVEAVPKNTTDLPYGSKMSTRLYDS